MTVICIHTSSEAFITFSISTQYYEVVKLKTTVPQLLKSLQEEEIYSNTERNSNSHNLLIFTSGGPRPPLGQVWDRSFINGPRPSAISCDYML